MSQKYYCDSGFGRGRLTGLPDNEVVVDPSTGIFNNPVDSQLITLM
jgi:hypothetical protein